MYPAQSIHICLALATHAHDRSQATLARRTSLDSCHPTSSPLSAGTLLTLWPPLLSDRCHPISSPLSAGIVAKALTPPRPWEGRSLQLGPHYDYGYGYSYGYHYQLEPMIVNTLHDAVGTAQTQICTSTTPCAFKLANASLNAQPTRSS